MVVKELGYLIKSSCPNITSQMLLTVTRHIEVAFGYLFHMLTLPLCHRSTEI
ncbi:hypothetical protein VAE122_2480024 [Vibrio aestuarianus]|nr:hypothetical protein VAE122_2480024 [Vibrio aestuarianus]